MNNRLGISVSEYTLDCRILPLRVTLDQDVLDFAIEFGRQVSLPAYMEVAVDSDEVGLGVEGDLIDLA